MRVYLITVILTSCIVLNAQNNHLNLLVGFGPGYAFNDKTLHPHIYHTEMIGLNYVFANKKQRIIFNPGINYTSNNYYGNLQNDQLLQVTQRVFNLNLDVLMKITRTKYLRVGLMANRFDASEITVLDANLFNRTRYGYSQLEKNYSSTVFQAGITVGLCFPFYLFKREHKFDIKIVQFASRIVDSDYFTDKSIIGEKTKILSTKVRPTMLVLALEFNLYHNKKKKKEAEEE